MPGLGFMPGGYQKPDPGIESMTLRRSLVPDLTTLQAFDAAARYGSFTQAATELNLTQSAVSRQVKELETRLGLQLFDRVRQRVILSEQGRRFLPDARRLLLQAEEMTIRAMSTRDLAGSLRVATLPTFAGRWLIPRLPDFLVRNPETQVTLFSRSTVFDFEAEPFDLAIHYGQPVWPHARCTFLCREEVVPVVSPDGLAKFEAKMPEGTTEAFDALAGFPLLHLETRPKLWAEWFAHAGRERRLAALAGHRFDQFGMIIEAAMAGIGVGLVPRYLIEHELVGGRLVVVIDLPMQTEQAYYIVTPEGKGATPLPDKFQDWLLGQVRR